jgi:bacterioferritin-associated ferredoxin
MYVCLCKGLSESAVRKVPGAVGAPSPQALIKVIGWDDGKCCGRCARAIDDIYPMVAQPTVCA